ncbi:MAG TPA: HDOD domain-containing protein [Polyangiaceae bacterium]|nr:HDOD domain-containing protein [Polyangiaceae bacterium]
MNSLVPPVSQRRAAANTGPRRILFVDDDELILRSVERVLRRPASERGWELCFATSGAAALDEMTRSPVEVLLADASMDQMSGATLLRKVQERDPSVVRILLSGHTGLDVLRMALPHAHQFLPKPCDGELLRCTLESACGLRSLLARAEMRQLVGSSNELPSAPRTFIELSNALANPHTSARTVSEIIERDIAISARVLQLVSSAFYGLPRAVTSIGGAVAYLGVEVIKAIVLSVEVSRMFPLTQGIPDFSVEALQQRGLRATQLAKRLLGHEPGGDVLVVAGLLQDAGQLVLASRAASRFGIALSTASTRKLPLYEVELDMFGATHAEIGGYLLGLWGLPPRVVGAVAHHLEPQRAGSRVFDAAAALYAANLLVENPDVPALEQVPPKTIALDLTFLRMVGVAHQLDEWRRLARAFGNGKSQAPKLAARA